MNKSTVTAASLATAAVLAAGLAVSAPADALSASHHTVRHGFGLDIAAAKAEAHTSFGHAMAVRRPADVPSSYSLQQYALSPGDQGQVGACVAWATGYTAYGLLMNEQGISGSPMAPMYIYSQIARGDDEGTTASVALPMEQSQGIDTKADYTQGDFDYTTQPTQAERDNAAQYKLSGFSDISGGDVQSNIESAISQGEPVAIGFEARDSFENLNSSDYNYDPSSSESIIGGHEVTIVGYDENGVTIENSWGSGWGNGGFFTAPWSWVTGGDVNEVHAIGGLVTS